MAIINDENFDASMYESGPVGAVVTTLITACAGIYDVVNYSCYYGKKAFGSNKQSAATAKNNGASGTWVSPLRTIDPASLAKGSKEPSTTRQVATQNKQTPTESTSGCVWDLTRPPRLITAPGCSTAGKRICKGQVICGNKSRVAVCSENFCKENTATECAKQLRYSSKVVN
ncbi:hypothetical protein [Pseudobdellovibrio sp. HCB154]|uniref:hypothetical protein n=1 Tax=Pseudobdellovibrio sp. HCB154 TaxID=3386277 RepID=UPI00391716E6